MFYAPINPREGRVLAEDGQRLAQWWTHTRAGDGDSQWLCDFAHADLFGFGERADLGLDGIWGKVVKLGEFFAEGLQKFEPLAVAFDEGLVDGLAVVDNPTLQ